MSQMNMWSSSRGTVTEEAPRVVRSLLSGELGDTQSDPAMLTSPHLPLELWVLGRHSAIFDTQRLSA
jgi:hypothetical protein